MTGDRRGTYVMVGVVAVVLAIVGFIALGGGIDTSSTGSPTATGTAAIPKAPSTSPKSATAPRPTDAPATTRVPGVPDRAYTTLVEIDAGRWPDSANAPGTKGGERWMNRDGDLAATDASGKAITYQEWDVNPKQRNRSRDAERIVTGSDGTAWYTGDHYNTFTRMR